MKLLQPRQSQTVTVTFSGAGVVVGYAPGVNVPPWLSVAQDGPVSSRGVTFAVAVDATLLAGGTFATSLRFATGLLPPSGAEGNATDVVFADVPVTLTVDDRPPTLDELCTEKARAECQVAGRCATTTQTCETQRKSLCFQFAAAAMAPGARTFRPDHIRACLGPTETAYAGSAPLTPAVLSNIEAACAFVFQGAAPLGSPCTTTYDCAGAPDSIVCGRGKCAVPVVVDNLESCEEPGRLCRVGSYCNESSFFTGPTCTPRKSIAEACDADNPCYEDLTCANGACAARRSTGGACESNDDCALHVPTCDPSRKVCTPGLIFQPFGAACASFGS